MADIYRTITERCAHELETAIRRAAYPSSIYVWAIPTTADRDGSLVVAEDSPDPAAVIIRPSDNHASTWHNWAAAPYSGFASILWYACRREPILPRERAA